MVEMRELFQQSTFLFHPRGVRGEVLQECSVSDRLSQLDQQGPGSERPFGGHVNR